MTICLGFYVMDQHKVMANCKIVQKLYKAFRVFFALKIFFY